MKLQTALKITGVAIGAIVLLSGCSGNQPTFNPKNKGITFSSGKPYLVPHGTKQSLYTKKTDKGVTRAMKEIKNNSNPSIRNNKKLYNGVARSRCRIGDLAWIENGIYEDAGRAVSHPVMWFAYITFAKDQGKAGCAHPLSNQEYQYVLNQKNQSQANKRADRQYWQQRELNRQVKGINDNLSYINRPQL